MKIHKYIMSQKLIQSYIKQLSDGLNGDPWVDVSLVSKLSTVDNKSAFTQPLPRVHSVAQLVSHVYQWSMSIYSILQGKGRTVSMDDPNNWLDNETLQAKGWEAIKNDCFANQQDIINFLSTQDDELLNNQYEGYNYEYYVQGLIHHNMYHMGQMGLVIKMLNDK